MHDSTRPDRDGPESSRSRPFRADNRLVITVAFVIMCLGILIGGHLYGRTASKDSSATKEADPAKILLDIKRQNSSMISSLFGHESSWCAIRTAETLAVPDSAVDEPLLVSRVETSLAFP